METQIQSDIDISRAIELLGNPHPVNQQLGIALISSVGNLEKDEDLQILLSNSLEKLQWCQTYQLSCSIQTVKIKGRSSNYIYHANQTGLSYEQQIQHLENFKNLSRLYLTDGIFRGYGYPQSKDLLDWNKLSKLNTLSLARNNLYTFPQGITNLKNLERLYLNENRLFKAPMELGLLQNLKALSLAKNRLSKLPAQIGGLKKLENLNLARNRFESIPAELGTLHQLESINISHNKLKKLPVEICNLPKLKTLNLRQNRLSNLPVGFEGMKQLENLYIGSNPIAKDYKYRDYIQSVLPSTKIRN